MENNIHRKISVIGLGYVGLPVAVAFAEKATVVGFDIDANRISELKSGVDSTDEVPSEELKKVDILYTTDPIALKNCDFHIIAVPTPVDGDNLPDLGPTLNATRTVGSHLKKGDIVVYESTFYPGVTEEDCIPLLEKSSGLLAGKDFFVGYSPERVNPGDPHHSFKKVRKVVSAQDDSTLEIVATCYASVVEAGVYKAQSIKVAEACKVIENSQRDINIAFVNEVSLILNALGIDTNQVLDAASTKWNFAPYRPGLVGGHCISVDPYYIIEKGRRVGIEAFVLHSARKRNESMATIIADNTITAIKKTGKPINGAIVTILGFTFKENCPDVRNSKVAQIVSRLQEHEVRVQVYDPLADPETVFHEYGIRLTTKNDLSPAAAVITAVAHDEFKKLKPEDLIKLMQDDPILMDVKGLFPKAELESRNITHWRL